MALILNILTAIYLLIHEIVWGIIKLFIPYKFRSKSVKDELVLITGTGNGIGKLLAERFSQLGAKVICVDIDQANNLKTCSNLRANGGEAYAYQCDLSKKEDIYTLIEEIKKNVGNPTILVNNAGILNGKKLLELSDNLIEKTFQINVLAHIWLVKGFMPKMIENNHGHIVTMASMAGIIGVSGLVDYSSSKFAAVGFDESLRNELLRLEITGVKTTVVCPIFVNTAMGKNLKCNIQSNLEPEYVADKIIEAVLTDQQILMMPRTNYFFAIIKTILPYKFQFYLDKVFFKFCYAFDDYVRAD